jgi:hypothetical protein
MIPARPRSQTAAYLASAACMLVGCYLVSGASKTDARDVLRLLPLLGWLNLYEILLIGLGVVFNARGQLRDSRLLLVLEAVFLADAAHVSGELVTGSQERWIWAAVGLLLLAAGKIAAAVTYLRAPLRTLHLQVLLPAAILVLGLPGIVAAAARSGVRLDLPLYGAAWATGLVLAVAALNRTQEVDSARAHSMAGAPTRPHPVAEAFGAALSTAFLVSLPAHLFSSHWLYDIPFRACSIAPLLLAGAVAVSRSPIASRIPTLRVWLPAAAVLCSLNPPESFVFGAGPTFSPLRATLLVACLVLVYDFLLNRHWAMLASSVAFGLFAAAGHTVETAADRIGTLISAAIRATRVVAPSSPGRWGVLAIVAAYALLWFGARASLRDARATTRNAER